MMKNNVKRIISVFAFFALVLSLFNIFASADNTADAKEPIDTSKKCSITLTYQSPEKHANGLEIKIYRAISVDDDIHFALTGDFSGYSIRIPSTQVETVSASGIISEFANSLFSKQRNLFSIDSYTFCIQPLLSLYICRKNGIVTKKVKKIKKCKKKLLSQGKNIS